MIVFVLVGLAWTGLFSRLSDDMVFSSVWGYLVFALVMLCLALVGVAFTLWFPGIIGAQIGFATMSFGLGMLLGPTLSFYAQSDIMKSLLATALVVMVFGIIGVCNPYNLEGLLPILLWAAGLIVAWLLTMPLLSLFGLDATGGLLFIDWVIIIVFSIWVVYDMTDAMNMNWTVRNASDAAVAIYLDFLNIFLAILDGFGYVFSGIGDLFGGGTPRGSGKRSGGDSWSIGDWVD